MGTLISVRTSTPTLSCPVAPPCTPVLLTECRRKSPFLLPPPSRSRSLLPLSVNTPSGLVVPFLLPCLLSRLCGSPRRNTTSLALELFTASASKLCLVSHRYKIIFIYLCICIHLLLLHT